MLIFFSICALLATGWLALLVVCWLVAGLGWLLLAIFPPSNRQQAKVWRRWAKDARRAGNYMAAMQLDKKADELEKTK